MFVGVFHVKVTNFLVEGDMENSSALFYSSLHPPDFHKTFTKAGVKWCTEHRIGKAHYFFLNDCTQRQQSSPTTWSIGNLFKVFA